MSCCLPDKNCSFCPRLVTFREINRKNFPAYHNGPVEAFGSLESEILVVGMAPGLHGANQTNRPFTNDYAGDILYPALKKFGFACGEYQKSKNDGFKLLNVRVTNAVRCVPPQNKVLGEETRNCRYFLAGEIEAMPNLKIILSLGVVSHNSVLRTLNLRQTTCKFSHGAVHQLPDGLTLVDSYHTSRYNINTGVLTREMFDDIIGKIRSLV